MPPAHEPAGQRHDRRVHQQAVQRGFAARPARRIEHDIRRLRHADIVVVRHRRQNDAVILRVQPARGECAAKPLAKHRRQRRGHRGDKDKPARSHRRGDVRKDPVVARGIFEQRLAGPEHRHRRLRPQRRAIHRDRPDVVRRVVQAEPRQPHHALGVVGFPIRRLHQVAGQEVVHRWHAGGLGMSPAHALHRRQPLRGQPAHHRVHADFRIEQDVGRGSGYCLAPRHRRRQVAHEPIAQIGGQRGQVIRRRAGVEAGHLKAVAVEFRQRAFQEQLEHRVRVEIAADDAQSDAFAG